MIDEKLEHDVVIGSRIRLARNIADFPFVTNCSDDQRHEIENVVRTSFVDDEQLTTIACVDSEELQLLERQFLLDLDRVTHQFAGDEETSEFDNLDSGELDIQIDNVSVQINEEDHLRLTVTRNDWDLNSAWEQLSQLDDRIESKFNYAFDERWGYLTACPANVGTGMRVSVLVHLPALVMTHQIDKVFRSLQKVGINARGVFDDQATGDFFRISNQSTLGCNESELIEQVSSIVPVLVRYERQAREFLLSENKEGVRRDVHQAFDELCRCDVDDDSQEAISEILSLLSSVRMGIGMGLIDQKDASRVQGMFLLAQLRYQLFVAVELEDFASAARIRDRIKEVEQAGLEEKPDFDGDRESGNSQNDGSIGGIE